MRSTLLALTIVLVACGRPDRDSSSVTTDAPSAVAARGPDNLVLRIARAGGAARVYAYPRLDTVVWSASSVPVPSRILAFDAEAGTVAYVDVRGLPARIDFRQGVGSIASKTKVTSIASADGSAIFAVTNGAVERYAPGGAWKWKPPVAARALFPQENGTILVLGERAGESIVWRVHPPSLEASDSVMLPRVDRALRTQVGDRLYLGTGSRLTGIRTRTMERTPDIDFGDAIELLAATPSGNRVFVVTKSGTAIDIVDRYQEKRAGSIDIGRNVSELRMDPIGRYLLARPEGRDSAIVVALGTDRVIGAVATAWRADLPFVAPDGGLALVQGGDVAMVDGETLRARGIVKGGAADFWYPFRWTGFRPRAASLDRPVEFEGARTDSAAASDSAAGDSALATVPGASVPAPATSAPKDSAPRRAAVYTVSFAALLEQDKARDIASQIRVGNEAARVVTATRDGASIFRVVLGPYPSREEAERIGRASGQSFWVYEGGP